MTVYFTDDFDFKTICKVDQGHECCGFITVDAKGFGCSRMDDTISHLLSSRIKDKKMIARGFGGWGRLYLGA